MLKENFKQKREELDDLLIELDVPKIYWHQLVRLNSYLGSWEFRSVNKSIDEEKLLKAMDLIHEISPERLTRFNIGEENEEQQALKV